MRVEDDLETVNQSDTLLPNMISDLTVRLPAALYRVAAARLSRELGGRVRITYISSSAA